MRLLPLTLHVLERRLPRTIIMPPGICLLELTLITPAFLIGQSVYVATSTIGAWISAWNR